MVKSWNKPKDYDKTKKFIKNNMTRWNFQVQDKYFHMAKKDWYRARSAFKLKEIDLHYDLLEPWMAVLDLWCAPWSFLQVIFEKVWHTWQIIWLDVRETQKVNKHVVTFIQDIMKTEEVKEKLDTLNIDKFDLITSDIAPNTSWCADVDQYKSVELNLSIVKIADIFLKQWWNLLLKVFVGSDVNELIQPIKNKYKKLIQFKPPACRKRSMERYFICLDKKL